jgi:putative FmdB family regulatory protein
MPLYEYECFVCQKRFERIQKVDADPIKQCPDCNGSVRRLLGVPALQFKGSGWYVNDYGKGNGNDTARERLDSQKDVKTDTSTDKTAKNEKTEKSEAKKETKSDAASKS